MLIIIKQTIMVFLSISLLSCSAVSAAKDDHSIAYQKVGEASFYANKFQGRKTASGETFHQNKKTAAHKKLPFGTKVKVTNLKNAKTVLVTINDRGPFVKGRIIDLSRSSFEAINSLNAGVIKVRIDVIK